MATGPTDLPDLDGFALTPEQVAELAPLQRASRQKREPRPSRARFVQLPYEQTLEAAGRLKDAPLAVLVELAHQLFKTRQNPVTLSNMALRNVGITHWAKSRALRKLEEGGLVEVSWRGHRSPRVTILWE